MGSAVGGMWDMCAIFSAQRKLISEKRCKNSKSCLLLFIHMAHLSEMVRVTVKEGLEDGFLGIVGLHVNPHKAEVFFSRCGGGRVYPHVLEG
eukprot:751761-Hanusia_phi.AAC.1